ncbi:Ribosomal protein S24/S35 [Quillaja saponaria]|uniref:Ribosomal protein S24/S35 n=1 Tax=Quillaja saponaria TaxID=32244 RepID=A0AAD7M5G7_QUISA|nr:Ribosomal protein S24/S35 [Quillaja saponaria]
MAMKRALFRNVSVYAGDLLLSSLRYKLNPNPTLVSLSASTQTKLRFYSSRNNSLGGTNNLSKTLNEDVPVDDEIVSNQELKRRIEKLYEGDADEIPSIFEAILKRKLAGKYEEADNELMEEIRSSTGKGPENDVDGEDEKFDSDSDGLEESHENEEIDFDFELSEGDEETESD